MRPSVFFTDYSHTLLRPLTNGKEKRGQMRPAATKNVPKKDPPLKLIFINQQEFLPTTDLLVEKHMYVERLRRHRVGENESDKAVDLPVFFLFVIGSALKHPPQP